LRESIKAKVLLGSEKTGLRAKERLSLDWSKITKAIGEVWGQEWDALEAARDDWASRQLSF